MDGKRFLRDNAKISQLLIHFRIAASGQLSIVLMNDEQRNPRSLDRKASIGRSCFFSFSEISYLLK